MCNMANLCNGLALAGCSPEKAGVGGSIPSLATIFSHGCPKSMVILREFGDRAKPTNSLR